MVKQIDSLYSANLLSNDRLRLEHAINYENIYKYNSSHWNEHSACLINGLSQTVLHRVTKF